MKTWHLILLGIAIVGISIAGTIMMSQMAALEEESTGEEQGGAALGQSVPAGAEGRPGGEQSGAEAEEGGTVELPKPRQKGGVSVEEAMLARRSIRSYSGEALTLEEISQLLWAAQGITNERGFRTAPSAGALYPLELYLVAGKVEGLAPGVYAYRPTRHDLVLVAKGDKREALSEAALGQGAVANGAVDIVFAGVYERTAKKYGERATRYVHIEVGHAAQNVFLQVVALDLGAAVIGAFHDEGVEDVVKMEQNEDALYIMPVGRKAKD